MYDNNFFTIGFQRSNCYFILCVFKQCISSCTKVSTWKFFFDNGESKYKCFLQHTQDNVVYVKPCFVTPIDQMQDDQKLNLVLDE